MCLLDFQVGPVPAGRLEVAFGPEGTGSADCRHLWFITETKA